MSQTSMGFVTNTGAFSFSSSTVISTVEGTDVSGGVPMSSATTCFIPAVLNQLFYTGGFLQYSFPSVVLHQRFCIRGVYQRLTPHGSTIARRVQNVITQIIVIETFL